METVAQTSVEDDRSTVADVLALDSATRVDEEAAAVHAYFQGDNASMMGGWT